MVEPINNKQLVPLGIYQARFKALDPSEVSTRTGVPFDRDIGTFTLNVLGFTLTATWPDFTLTPEDKEHTPPILFSLESQILLIRHLIEGAHAPLSGKYLSYRELPWGDVYDGNFQGRCIKRLAFGYGSKLDAFAKAAEKLGGVRFDRGDVSYDLPFFKDLSVRMTLWSGDDEFPPTSQILFSDNTPLAFTAEDVAVLGDVVIGALKQLAK